MEMEGKNGTFSGWMFVSNTFYFSAKPQSYSNYTYHRVPCWPFYKTCHITEHVTYWLSNHEVKWLEVELYAANMPSQWPQFKSTFVLGPNDCFFVYVHVRIWTVASCFKQGLWANSMNKSVLRAICVLSASRVLVVDSLLEKTWAMVECNVMCLA